MLRCMTQQSAVLARSAFAGPQALSKAGRVARVPVSRPRVGRGRLMCSAAAEETKNFLLEYVYVPEILDKRGPYREEHLAMAKEQIAAGNMKYGGPLNPPTGAVFLWTCDDPAIIEEYAKKDPYVKAGLVPSYKITEWSILLK
mmetsp:Transcript_31402/g.68662  ORF Transcript_31402/g.68662 Transcript_31402/m.68662 type:complete len:143 (-) Transcript_31402:1102-1530(-)